MDELDKNKKLLLKDKLFYRGKLLVSFFSMLLLKFFHFPLCLLYLHLRYVYAHLKRVRAEQLYDVYEADLI